MPFTTRRLPPPRSVEPRPTIVLPRGPNIQAYLSLTLGLVVPAGIFFAGLAGVFVGFQLDFWHGLLSILVAAFAAVGAIYTGIGALRHAGGSREPGARRNLALLGLGRGYLDAAALVAFIVWTLIRAVRAIHLGG
jgi:hypothetical protein